MSHSKDDSPGSQSHVLGVSEPLRVDASEQSVPGAADPQDGDARWREQLLERGSTPARLFF